MQLKKTDNRLTLYFVTMILALEVMLSFSIFGYITVGTFTLSFVPIGVYAMGLLFGVKSCMLAGAVFGLTSMMMASVGGGAGLDYLYSPVLSGSPISSIILAIGTRLFLGVIAGITLKMARSAQKARCIKLVLATIVTQCSYTVVTLIVGAIVFPATRTSIVNLSNLLINLIMECIVFSVVLLMICKVGETKLIQVIIDNCRLGIRKTSMKENTLYTLCVGTIFLIFNAGLGSHYWKMSKRTLDISKIVIDRQTQRVLFHLELQQLLSNLALYVITTVVVMTIYFYVIERHDQLTYRADRDMMTGLYNRNTARYKIQMYRNIYPNTPCAFILIDIDELKMINDTLGHAAGDNAIIGVANALKSTFRQNDIIARLGGDEFFAFLGGLSSKEDLSPILDRLQKAVSEVSIGDEARKPHVSIGVELDPTGQLDIDELYRNADEALYYTKKHGKNTYSYH